MGRSVLPSNCLSIFCRPVASASSFFFGEGFDTKESGISPTPERDIGGGDRRSGGGNRVIASGGDRRSGGNRAIASGGDSRDSGDDGDRR